MHFGRAPRERALLLLPLALGALLRAYPMHRPYLGIELQELYPSNAVAAVTGRNWEPFALFHGGGLLTLLRALFTLWYAAGSGLGVYQDRLDLLASYLGDSFPFILAGRLVLLACALASIWLVGRLATRFGGTAAGVAGAAVLAVTFIHVRESHHVWLDVPAGLAALVTTAAALRAARDSALRRIALAGALAGVALATKYSSAPVALPLLLAVLLGSTGAARNVLGRALVAGAAALGAFAVLSPYTLIKMRETLRVLGALHTILFSGQGAGLSLLTCLHQGIGVGILGCALLGLGWNALQTPRSTAIAAAFPLAYLAVLSREGLLYARYLAVLAPFTALFAGLGTAALGRRLVPASPYAGVALVTLAIAAAPAVQSLGYDRLLARRDTRQMAGDWIREHVPAGTPLALPNAVPYPNPVLPIDALQLRLQFPRFAAALQARGVADPQRTWPAAYLGMFDEHSEKWQPDRRFVVTAHHPVVLKGMNPPPAYMERLAAAGARAVARFDGYREPISADVVFEPVEADYVPLAGFGALLRPGPNLIVWEVPGVP